jgi:hypothetical protein
LNIYFVVIRIATILGISRLFGSLRESVIRFFS